MSTPTDRHRTSTPSSGYRVIPGRPTLELRFAEMPKPEALERIKASGFHWSPSQKAWYAPDNAARQAMAKALFPSG